MPQPLERCMEDGERETLTHLAAELRAVAANTQRITPRVPLPTSALDESDLLSIALGAEGAAEWVEALLRYGYWWTPNPVLPSPLLPKGP